ncbi:hypothetical protein [Spiroplasma sp. SV19]|uniref:hypothetical protein n=1 Tax=Spiroplasma sp. SV19 TaxID=2570468 RepID=UPI0024B64284|nr:hypothetical protein [Spiroplasma sp. SV19]WHQ36857.1 hypothetical protein E7Y35_03005 [Spiroplasma sp. SV19]
MKKILIVLVTSILTGNTIMQFKSPLNQQQNLELTQNKVDVELIKDENENFGKYDSNQNFPAIIKSIVDYFNSVINIRTDFRLTTNTAKVSKDWIKEGVINDFEIILESNFWDIMRHINLDCKFSNFILPKKISYKDTKPGSIDVQIGVKSTLDKEFMWTKTLTYQIILQPVISKNKAEHIVISTRDNKEGFSNGFAYNNQLYFTNVNRLIRFNQQTSEADVVMEIENNFTTNGVLYKEKLYFGAEDGYVYEYNPANNVNNKILKANGIIKSNGIVVANKLYFGADDYKLYQYNAINQEAKVVMTAKGAIRHSGTAFNNKLYFGAEDGRFYIYDPKLEHIETWNYGAVVFDSGVVFNNKIYFIGVIDNIVNCLFRVDLKDDTVKVSTYRNRRNIFSSAIILNNRIFFLVSWVSQSDLVVLYELNQEDHSLNYINSLNYVGPLTRCLNGIIWQNKIHFVHSSNLIKYDLVKNEFEYVKFSGYYFGTCGVILNNKLYFEVILKGILEYNLPTSY